MSKIMHDIIPLVKKRKIFFDIIPPERIKIEKPLEARSFSEIKKPLKTKKPLKVKKVKTIKPEKFIEEESFLLKNSLKRRALKIACLFLIVFFGWAGLSNINKTLAYFSDLEASIGNIFKSGFLDFELVSFSDFSPYFIDLGESASRTISVVNYGNKHKYTITADNFSSELCDYLTLEASLNNELKYTGPLVDFINFGLIFFEDPTDWFFELTLPFDVPQSVQGQACDFDFIFFASQTRNNLLFGKGFTGTKQISNSVSMFLCKDIEFRSMGYWKNHPEIYESYLPQFLGDYQVDEEIDTVEKVQEVFDSRNNIMRNNLRKQLLAMKFNVVHFEIGEYLIEGENKTINQIIVEADNLLRNFDATKDELEEAKDLIDYLNNLGKIEICLDDSIDITGFNFKDDFYLEEEALEDKEYLDELKEVSEDELENENEIISENKEELKEDSFDFEENIDLKDAKDFENKKTDEGSEEILKKELIEDDDSENHELEKIEVEKMEKVEN